MTNIKSIGQATELFHELTESYGFYSIDSALYYAECLVALKPLIPFLDKKSIQYIAYGFNNKGVLLQVKGQTTESLDFLIEGAKIQEHTGNQNLLLSNYSSISHLYKFRGAYSKALDYSLKALKIAEDLSDSSQIYLTKITIASIYEVLKDFDEAQNRYQTIINEIQKSSFEGKTKVLSTAYNNYGKMLLENNLDLDKSLELFEKAIELSYEMDDEISRATFLANQGGVYHSLEKYDEAIEKLNLSLKIRLKFNRKLDVCKVYTNLSKSHYLAVF